MSAVISGNGLGLFNGSASQIGTGLGGGARLGQGRDNQYVNIATGNLLLQSQDEQLLFRGLGIAAQRTYNSRGQLAEVGADAWITGFERRVELLSGALNAAGSVMRRYTGDGSYQDFAFVSTDLYRSTTGDGAHDTLGRDGASSTWTWVEGSTRREEQYANHADAVLKGRLTRIRDLKSDGVSKATWNVVYDASNRISEVQAVEGGPQEALIFGYDANSRLITLSTRINGVVNEQVTYGYDSAGRLSSVLVDLTPADAAGDRDAWDAANLANNDGYRFQTVYSYVDATSLQLSQVRQSDGTLVSYTYDAQGRVRTLTRGDSNTDDSDGAGQTLTFTYDSANRSTEVADSTGRSWGYVYDAAGQLIEVRSPAVSGVRDLTQYSYDASGNVTRIKAVRGSVTLSETVYQYDANGNVLWQWNTVNPASGTAATAVQRTYTASNQLASETVYTGLDADRELSAQAPSGGLTTSYVYDTQDRVRFVIDALGAVREFEYETTGAGAGQVSKSRQYLGAAYTGAMNLAGLTAWATNAQRAQSTLSESSYDLKGRLSGSKVYAAVDGSGNGVENDATEIVQYQYDAHGQLTQRRVLRSSTVAANDGRDTVQTTTYLYDGMGRLLSEVSSEKIGAGSDEVRRTTSRWIYQDSGASVRMVIEGGTVNDGVTSNDLLRVEVRDKAGQLISVSDSALSGGTVRTVSKNYYDTAGRLRASEDAGGARTYFFYDDEGQLAAQVDETGAVIEFVRDDLGRVIQTTSYATRVDASAWLVAGKVVPATIAAIRPATTADDRVNTSTYDALGRLLTQTSGSDGATTNAPGTGYKGSKFSAQFNLTGEGGRIVYKAPIPVRPGERVTLSAAVQQGASSSGEAGAGVFLYWLDANGNPIGDNGIVRGNMVTDGSGGAWHLSSLSAVAPPNAAYMKIGGVAYRSGGNDPLWMDDFAWSFSVPNGDFGEGDTGWSVKEPGWNIVANGPPNTDYSASFHGSTPGRIYSDARPVLRPGQWISASALVQRNSSNSGGGVFIQFLDANGNGISVARGTMIESGSGWQESRLGPVQVPPGAVTMVIGGVAYANGGSPIVMNDFTWQYPRDEEMPGAPGQGGVPYNDPTSTKTYWYDYDAENRVTVSHGKLVNGQIVLGNPDVSYGLAYDAAGRAVHRRFLQGQQVMQETTQYDQRGQRRHVFMAQPLGGNAPVALKEQYVYDDLGRVIERREYFDADDHRRNIPVPGWIQHAETYEYDADGRLLRQNSYGRPLLWTPDPTQSQATRTDRNALSLISQIDYARYGYDDAGRSRGYAFVSHAREDQTGALPDTPIGYTHYYTYQYEARESYLEAAVHGTSSNANFRPTTTYSQYDGWGHRIAVREHTPKQLNMPQLDDRVRYFAYDHDGNILRRSEGHLDSGIFKQNAAESGRTQTYAYANGQNIASGMLNGQVDLLGRLTAYQNSEAGDMRVPVQAGDTLRRIAGRVYGNENLWYVLAAANALEGADTELTAGTTINVPQVKVSANDAHTFKPFDPNEAIGNTTPNLPYIEPPPKNHCNAIAAVLAVAIVAVAYVFAPYVGLVVQNVLGTGALATGVTTGVATVAASTVVRGAASAIGVASFDWRDVAVDGITAGVTAGAGGYLAGIATFGKVAADGSRVLNTAGRVAQGMASYGGTVVANATVGRDTYFSWKGVAATAAGAYLGARLNPSGSLPITDGSSGFERFANDFAGSALDGAINATARRSMGLGKQNWGQIAVDAFGNAIGNAFIGGLQARQVEQQLLDGFTPEQVRAYKQFKAQGEADGMTAASVLRNMRADIPIEDQVGLIRRTLEMSQADPGIFDSDYRRGMAQEYLGMIRGDGGAALSQEDIGRTIRLLEENGAFRLGVPEVIVRQQELMEVDTAVVSAPFESLVDSPADLESELRARREQEHPALLNQKIDAAAQGVGKVVTGMGRAIEKAPILKYGLVAMDVASGPAMYLVREGLAATPVGSWIEAGQERAVGAVSNRFEERPGYSRADAGNAAVGTVSVGGMTFFGAAGLLKRLPMIERLLAKLPKAKFSDGREMQVAGTYFDPPSPGLRVPQGVGPRTFDILSAKVRAAVGDLGLGDDVFVMGSRAGGTAKVGADFDFGVRVSPDRFKDLISDRFGSPNPKSAKFDTMERSMRDGRIQTGEAGLRGVRQTIAETLRLPPEKVQISIIQAGGVFDNGPQTQLSFGF